MAQQRLLDGIVELVTADGAVLAHALRAIAAHIGRDHGAAPMLFEGAAPPSSRAAARR